MSAGVFLTVLLAALIHAIWNAAAKGSIDKMRFMTGLVLGHAPFAAAALLVAPLPAWACWP
ncbi:MAG: EamA family transporter, partial [Sphingomonadaceae bacterium]|nr:EamA family transporter [Sphingomonadaceae bacterium]